MRKFLLSVAMLMAVAFTAVAYDAPTGVAYASPAESVAVEYGTQPESSSDLAQNTLADWSFSNSDGRNNMDITMTLASEAVGALLEITMYDMPVVPFSPSLPYGDNLAGKDRLPFMADAIA